MAIYDIDPSKRIADQLTDELIAECLKYANSILPNLCFGTIRVMVSKVALAKMNDLQFAAYYLHYPLEIMASYRTAKVIEHRRRQLRLDKRNIITPDKL